MDASEIYSKRLNAKGGDISQRKSEKFIFPIADGTNQNPLEEIRT